MRELPDDYEARWLVESMMLERGLNILLGAPKARKSTLRRYLSAALLLGREVFPDFPTKKVGKILSLVGESAVEYESTLQALPCKSLGIENFSNRLFITKPINFNISSASDLTDLIELVRLEKFELVTIDPLVNFHSEDENDATGMGKVCKNLLILSDVVTVLVIHHTAKPSDADEHKTLGQMARGSSVLAGASDTTLLLRRRGESSAGILHFETRHANEPENLEVFFDSETGLWLPAALAPSVEDRVRELLQEEPSLSSNELVKRLRARRRDVLEAVKRLKLVPGGGSDPGSGPIASGTT